MSKTFDELLYEETQDEVFLDLCLSEDGELIDIVSKGATLNEVLESTTFTDGNNLEDLDDEKLFEKE